MITERTNEKGVRFLDIETERCKAVLCLQGAHLISWIPAGHEECLFTSRESFFEPGMPIRGGIPLCWPWFGRKPGVPQHGIARISMWEIDHHGDDLEDGVASIHLRLYPEDGQMPVAFLRITLGNELSMRLQTTSRKIKGSLTTAFHNYLRVGDVRQCSVHGLSRIPYRQYGVHVDALRKQVPLHPEGPMDRIYAGERPVRSVRLEDPVLRRSMTIESENSHSLVVWNPWEEGARAMADLGDDEWSRFICLEPAVTDPEAIELSPGHTHVMRQVIKVASL